MSLNGLFGLTYLEFRNLFPEIPVNNIDDLAFLGKNNINAIVKRLNKKIAISNTCIDFCESLLVFLRGHATPEDIEATSCEYLDLDVKTEEIETRYLDRMARFPGTTSFNGCVVCEFAYGYGKRRNCRFLELSHFNIDLDCASKCYLKNLTSLGLTQLKIDISMRIQDLNNFHDKILKIRAFIRSISAFSACKPFLPAFRPQNHFKPGDQIVFCYPPKPINRSIWALGRIYKIKKVAAERNKKFCFIELEKNLNFRPDSGKGYLVAIPADAPDIMHPWEAEFLAANPEYLRNCWLTGRFDGFERFIDLIKLAA